MAITSQLLKLSKWSRYSCKRRSEASHHDYDKATEMSLSSSEMSDLRSRIGGDVSSSPSLMVQI